MDNNCCYREQLSYALYAKFREPKLFRMAVAGNWDKIPARCRSHPSEAAFVHKYPPADTALHRILRPAIASCSDTTEQNFDQKTLVKMNEMRNAAVSALLEANPSSALVRDSFGRTPLHWACMNVGAYNDNNTASLIIKSCPEAVPVLDSERRTALHSLVARNVHIPIDILTLLLDIDCSTGLRCDIVGESPSQIVDRRKVEIQNAEEVLKVLTLASKR
jgi:ankyrin repeat protein